MWKLAQIKWIFIAKSFDAKKQISEILTNKGVSGSDIKDATNDVYKNCRDKILENVINIDKKYEKLLPNTIGTWISSAVNYMLNNQFDIIVEKKSDNAVIEQPAEAIVEQSAEAIVEQPVGDTTEQSDEALAEQSAETVFNQPAEAIVEQPVGDTTEQSTEAPTLVVNNYNECTVTIKGPRNIAELQEFTTGLINAVRDDFYGSGVIRNNVYKKDTVDQLDIESILNFPPPEKKEEVLKKDPETELNEIKEHLKREKTLIRAEDVPPVANEEQLEDALQIGWVQLYREKNNLSEDEMKAILQENPVPISWLDFYVCKQEAKEKRSLSPEEIETIVTDIASKGRDQRHKISEYTAQFRASGSDWKTFLGLGTPIHIGTNNTSFYKYSPDNIEDAAYRIYVLGHQFSGSEKPWAASRRGPFMPDALGTAKQWIEDSGRTVFFIDPSTTGAAATEEEEGN